MKHEPRLVIAGRPHHVYLRGNNHRLLFASHTDRVFWIECVRRALDATRCQLHQMTLMSNRVHAIVTPPEPKALSAMVKRACERYAHKRNQQRVASGRLFAVGFRSHPLFDDNALRDTTLHADASALRAAQTEDPFAHEWSTAPLHAGLPGTHELRAIWTPSTWYVRLGSTPDARARAFREAMIEYLVLGGAPPIDLGIEAEDESTYRRRPSRRTA